MPYLIVFVPEMPTWSGEKDVKCLGMGASDSQLQDQIVPIIQMMA